VDHDAKAINNCPPVTLTIESGPGEFPTGPGITFAADSDITIRDGQAAMEFRSYYSGDTVIRATSPGLKVATIQITSRGEPKFIAGKTPSVKPRPYVRFSGVNSTNSLLAFGRENPTRASSETPGHSARLANDGNPATFWQADAGDSNAWFRVDLERIVSVSRTRLSFPGQGTWRYKIEISADGESNWKLFADQTHTADSSAERTDLVQGGSMVGRFVRVTVVESPLEQLAALAELEVFGTPASP
jgi:hypothetical protein